eukprot:9056229-Ditylum_brightwellii.AAC.1
MALFEVATKPVLSDQYIDITILNAQKILNLLEDMTSLYGWSGIIRKIKDVAGDKMTLLSQYNCLMFDNLKRHANQYYSGNPVAVTVSALAAMKVVVLDPANDARCTET